MVTLDHQIFTSEDYRLLQQCIHCGLCLASCPTYIIDGKEADSPRGRLELMHAIDRGTDPNTRGAFHHIDRCLGCLACQTACPSGVPYGHLLEHARDFQRREVQPLGLMSRLMLTWLTRNPQLGIVSQLIRIVQRTGLDRLLRTLRLGPASLRFQLGGFPAIRRKPFSHQASQHLPAVAGNHGTQGTVALFTGCVMDHWYAEVHAATTRVLNWNGFDVLIPSGQVCCGALHAHAGDLAESDRLLAVNREIFAGLPVDAIVLNSAGCGAHLRDYLWSDSEGPPVLDVSEVLCRGNLRLPRNKISQRITYDEACHLHHAQAVQHDPYKLLSAACETVVALPEADICCGSAGLYSLLQREMSQELLARKIEHIRAVAPDILVTGNPGCLMQLQGGLHQTGMKIPVQHTIQILDAAYRAEEPYRRAFGLSE
jgi:glycolate oxidase iron-sulfur subunit